MFLKARNAACYWPEACRPGFVTIQNSKGSCSSKTVCTHHLRSERISFLDATLTITNLSKINQRHKAGRLIEHSRFAKIAAHAPLVRSARTSIGLFLSCLITATCSTALWFRPPASTCFSRFSILLRSPARLGRV